MAVKKSPGIGVKLLLVVASALVGLFLAEIASRYLYRVEMAHFVDCDARPTDIRIDDPELEVRLKPHFCGKLVGSEFQSSIRTNSSGFRDDREFSKEKGDAYRIFGLGDSFTFGWGVEQDQTYLSLLRRKLENELGRKVEAFNLGVWGYGTIQEIKVFRMFQAYRPDLVILQFYARDAYVDEAGNDLVDNYHFQQWYESRSEPKGGSRRQAGSYPPMLRRAKQFVSEDCNLCRILALEFGFLIRRGFHPNGDEGRTATAWQITRDALTSFDADLESMNIKGLLLWVPPLGTVQAGDNAVVGKLNSFGFHNIVVVSSLSLLRQNAGKYYYSLDTHWRPAGHQAVADLLFRTIVAQGAIPKRDQVQLTATSAGTRNR